MSSNYLELDINKLFEEHTIKEIEEIQKKIQLESDRKKIELRSLVGERYRDLILAADTIANMKITSEKVVDKIIRIENKFKELQKKYLIGFKIEPIEDKVKKEPNDTFDSIVIQIKIMMDVPEYIWTAIDEKNLFLATQLFLIAQHINYSLILEVGNDELSKKYSLVLKQWNMISQLKSIISNECNKTLQSLDISVERTANCLASLVLLNETSHLDLLDKLIASRNHAIRSVIQDEGDNSVKKRIKMCIQILIQTVNLIYSCFISFNEKEGLVIQNIKNVKNIDAYSLLSKLDVNNEIMDTFLPPIIKSHKVFTKDIQNKFLPEDVEKSVKSWLEWIKDFCNLEITKLLNLIMSVKGLYNIREEATKINLPENWNVILKQLSLPDINLYSEFFQPLITERAKCIINDNWSETSTELKTRVHELLNKLAQDKCEFPEHDLRWFVWADSPLDIPQKLTKNGELDNDRPLLMKTKGFSPNVVELCKNLDKNLLTLLVDLEKYLFESEKTLSVKDSLLSTNVPFISNSFSDRGELLEYLQTVSERTVKDFISFLKLEYVSEKPVSGKSDINVIVMARFLMALTSLSPNLNKCFTLSKTSGFNISDSKWTSICDNLSAESFNLWSLWAGMYKSKMKEHCEKYMNKSILDNLNISGMISEWERVTIEEEAEKGNSIKSEILVPYQPSIALQNFLTTVNKDLNKIVPHTIPKKVLHDIVNDVATELLKYYLDLSQNSNPKQKQALQILFDVKFISLLMLPKENKLLMDNVTRASEAIRSRIDPFDYNVFHPFIQINTKKCTQRSLLILGNLIPHMEQLHSTLGSRGDCANRENGKSEPPAVLATCTGAPWFPPLAVTAPTRNLPLVSITLPEKTQKKKVTKEHTRNDSAGSTIKSGAAAFFGAMGTDWFSAT